MSGRVWLLALIYFLNALVNYGVFLWMPKILHDASTLRDFALGLVTAVPFVLSLAAMVLVGRHSDRSGERKWHAATCALTAATGLVLAALSPNHFPLLVLCLALSELGHRSTLAVFWAIPPIFLAGSAAATGIALINSIGNLGGAVGPTVVGWMRAGSGGYGSGLVFLAGCLVLQATLIATLRIPGGARTDPRRGDAPRISNRG
jgi:MFS family permease